MTNKEYIEMTLSNDESSTDEELIDLFMQETKISQEEAAAWVKKRSYYLTNQDLRDRGMVK